MSGYPAGYQDPPWDGSLEQFRDTVIPARVEALTSVLNSLLPPGYVFEWTEV